MKLVIFDDEMKYRDKGFLEFVLKKMKQMTYANINYDKLIRAEEFINSVSKYKSIYKKYISAREVVIAGILNMEYTVVNNKITFGINNVQNVPGTTAKLHEVCRLINNGNMVLNGYPIFTTTFEFFKKHIDDYYDIYVNGGWI